MGPREAALLAGLEQDLGGRLGVFALDTGTGQFVAYREHERFAMCSTFKAIAAAAVLQRNDREPGFLRKHVRYTRADLVTYSPVTEKHAESGMSLEALCAATVITSDNTAGNLILRELGGPAGLTAFARATGDAMFRLDRWEPDLNSAIEGDPRDTSTPAAMTRTLQALLVGDALAQQSRATLNQWMRDCATGAARIRAAIPEGWTVGDKTGTGSFGSANDVGIVWPPGRAPIVLTIFTVQRSADAKARNDIVAAAARIAMNALTGMSRAVA